MLELTGAIICLLGSLFLFLGALGVVRMPDVYNRMQAGTKATTLGSVLFFVGVAFAKPTWTGKIVLLILFIIVTNPVASHALARAAHFTKIKLTDKSVVDHLEEEEAKK
ncbi:MAG: hypothetical protein B6226_02830 [Candidatus Cloacimonetes bacterium 4572_65]|nr:MAG: hypothetical protein B6226_02830 [Candidatus Cloacimonetes bacterium 4572_65]